MSRQNNSRAGLFGTTSQKSYAAHPVWKGSVRGEVKFQPLGANRAAARRERSRLYHHARRYDRATTTRGRHAGKIGRIGLAILHAMLFDFIDLKTGRLDPGYETIARVANVSIRSVARGIGRLKAAGIITWLRRVYEKETAPGSNWEMAQNTNAYAILPATQWKGWTAPPEPPPPEPASWGRTPPQPDALGQAAEELAAGAGIAGVVAVLDRGDSALGGALARLYRRAKP
jgi:hypothetical protein